MIAFTPIASFYYVAPATPAVLGAGLLGVFALYVLARTKSAFRGFLWGGLTWGLLGGTAAALGAGDMADIMALGCAVAFGIAGAVLGTLAAMCGRRYLPAETPPPSSGPDVEEPSPPPNPD